MAISFIERIDVTIRPRLAKTSTRMDRCADVFERYCTVTSSVRQGIDVRVAVDWQIEDPMAGMAAAPEKRQFTHGRD